MLFLQDRISLPACTALCSLDFEEETINPSATITKIQNKKAQMMLHLKQHCNTFWKYTDVFKIKWSCLHNLYWPRCTTCRPSSTTSCHVKLTIWSSHTFDMFLLCICRMSMYLTYVYTLSLTLSLSHTWDHTIVSAAAELLHCSMVQVLPLQIRLLDNLSQLQYEGKWLTSIIYISQPLSLSSLSSPEKSYAPGPSVPGDPVWIGSIH